MVCCYSVPTPFVLERKRLLLWHNSFSASDCSHWFLTWWKLPTCLRGCQAALSSPSQYTFDKHSKRCINQLISWWMIVANNEEPFRKPSSLLSKTHFLASCGWLGVWGFGTASVCVYVGEVTDNDATACPVTWLVNTKQTVEIQISVPN